MRTRTAKADPQKLKIPSYDAAEALVLGAALLAAAEDHPGLRPALRSLYRATAALRPSPPSAPRSAAVRVAIASLTAHLSAIRELLAAQPGLRARCLPDDPAALGHRQRWLLARELLRGISADSALGDALRGAVGPVLVEGLAEAHRRAGELLGLVAVSAAPRREERARVRAHRVAVATWVQAIRASCPLATQARLLAPLSRRQAPRWRAQLDRAAARLPA